jgi:predicted nucleic acid-binding protein
VENIDMKVLLDTNQLIRREDPTVLRSVLATLLRTLASNRIGVVIHPRSLEELRRDSNARRSRKILSKLRSYPTLTNLGPVEPTFVNRSGPVSRPNDEVDVALLFAVDQRYASLLVTEDRGLIRRAVRVGLQDYVLTPEDATGYFSDLLGRQAVGPSAVAGWIRAFQVDRSDRFFESLVADYPEFMRWFDKIGREGRWCLTIAGPEGEIIALLILKDETERVASLPAKRRLKICTFKVDESATGFRIGELLVYISMQYARLKRFSECYVTVLPSHPEIVETLRVFGFDEVGKKGSEGVLVKRLNGPPGRSTLTPVEYLHRYYPSYLKGDRVTRFLVPILPEYHRRLFPDYCLPTHPNLPPISPGLSSTAGNAIRKAYLSGSRTTLVKPGDILLFYRSHDRRRITHTGVVEELLRSRSPDELLQFVGNRTVLPRSEVRDYCARGPVLAIRFWNIGELQAEITDSDLRAVGHAVPQSITQLPMSFCTKLGV